MKAAAVTGGVWGTCRRLALAGILLTAMSAGTTGCGSSGEVRVERGDPINGPSGPSGPSGTRAGPPRPGNGAPFSD